MSDYLMNDFDELPDRAFIARENQRNQYVVTDSHSYMTQEGFWNRDVKRAGTWDKCCADSIASTRAGARAEPVSSHRRI